VRDVAGGQGRPRHLDHRADPDPRDALDVPQHGFGLRAYRLEFLYRADQRHHDLGSRIATGGRPQRRRFRDGPYLHGEQAGDDQAESDPA
jgi:hypothetical protein